jgi:hypothetical protein
MFTFYYADTSHINDTIKNGTEMENKSGAEGQFASSAEYNPPPRNSFTKPRRAGDI